MSKLWIANFILQRSRDIKDRKDLSGYIDNTISTYFRKQGERIEKNCRFQIRWLASEPYLVDIGDHVFDWPFVRGQDFLRRKFYRLSRVLIPPRVATLERTICELKPDIIYSLQMKDESYPLLDVKRKLGERFSMPWVYSSWGHDMFFFRRETSHIGRIKAVLAACSYYISDCKLHVATAPLAISFTIIVTSFLAAKYVNIQGGLVQLIVIFAIVALFTLGITILLWRKFTLGPLQIIDFARRKP